VRLPSTRPLVYLITDGSATDRNYDADAARIIKLIEAAVTVNIPLIQIREKSLSSRNLFDLAKQSAAAVKFSNSRLLINDRVDIALAAEADGVHLTSRSYGPAAVRRIAPAKFLIGVSTHSIDEISSARDDGADFAVLGPIFETVNKGTPMGVEELKNAVTKFPELPVLGLGGICIENYRYILATGAAGFAGISLMNTAEKIETLSRIIYQ